MDYINYVKQSPMMGQIGLGGGATSLGMYNSGVGIEDWAGSRGFIGGGYAPSTPSPYHLNNIQYVTFSSLGNASDFGDLSEPSQAPIGISQKTRVLHAGGRPPSPTPGPRTEVDSINPDSNANATDWGDLVAGRGVMAVGGNSNGTRGLIISGSGSPSPRLDNMQYLTILTGNQAYNFGDMNNSSNQTAARWGGGGIQGNETRSIAAGGESGSSSPWTGKGICYVTTATTGNAQGFGDLAYTVHYGGGCANATRGVWFGSADGSNEEKCQYITVDTTGDATDFADMPTQSWYNVSSNAMASNGSGDIGVSMGNAGPYASECCSKAISTTANATNFGHLAYDAGYGSQGAAGGS